MKTLNKNQKALNNMNIHDLYNEQQKGLEKLVNESKPANTTLKERYDLYCDLTHENPVKTFDEWLGL